MSHFQQGNVAHALNFTIELEDYYTQTGNQPQEDTVARLAANRELYIQELGGEATALQQAQMLTEEIENPNPNEYTVYNMLCRGEKVEVSKQWYCRGTGAAAVLLNHCRSSRSAE